MLAEGGGLRGAGVFERAEVVARLAAGLVVVLGVAVAGAESKKQSKAKQQASKLPRYRKNAPRWRQCVSR